MATTAAIPEFGSENEVLEFFQKKKEEYQSIQQKILELEADQKEHELVLKTLADMEDGRKCYRLVGTVMVERTVGQVVPAVQQNKDGIEDIIEKMGQKLEVVGAILQAVQQKYKIQYRGAGQPQATAAGDGESGSSTNSRGVLA